jgi:hypothetical protein
LIAVTVSPPKRRSFQFSLRTLLVLVTVGCLVGGWWINRAFQQRAAVRRFYELTADRPSQHGDSLTTMGYRYQGKDQYYKPIIPKSLHWLGDMIGEECFGEVTGVQILDTPATNDDLKHLAVLPSVERIWLSRTKVDDDGMPLLKACPKLNFLGLDELPITDAGISHLTAFQNLESLSLSGTKITDAGLEYLAKLPRLKEVWLRNTAITDAGYQKLQAALPDCQIQADVPTYQQKLMEYWGTTGVPTW